MALLMLVAEASANEPVLGPSAADELRGLGITRVALLRDGNSLGLVLEGWAFSLDQASQAVSAVFGRGYDGVRTFVEIESVSLAPRS
jgi:hypothetical protein